MGLDAAVSTLARIGAPLALGALYRARGPARVRGPRARRPRPPRRRAARRALIYRASKESARARRPRAGTPGAREIDRPPFSTRADAMCADGGASARARARARPAEARIAPVHLPRLSRRRTLVSTSFPAGAAAPGSGSVTTTVPASSLPSRRFAVLDGVGREHDEGLAAVLADEHVADALEADPDADEHVRDRVGAAEVGAHGEQRRVRGRERGLALGVDDLRAASSRAAAAPRRRARPRRRSRRR